MFLQRPHLEREVAGARRGRGRRRARRPPWSRTRRDGATRPCGSVRRPSARPALRRVDDERHLAGADQVDRRLALALTDLGDDLVDGVAEARQEVGRALGGGDARPSSRRRLATTRPGRLVDVGERRGTPCRRWAGSCRLPARPCRTPARTCGRCPSPHRSSASRVRAPGRPRGTGRTAARPPCTATVSPFSTDGRSSPRRAARRASPRASRGSPPWPAARRSPWRRTGSCGSPAGWPRSRTPSSRRRRTAR